MSSKVLLLLACLVLVSSGVAMAGTASWWSVGGCPGTAAATSSQPTNGACFSISGVTGIQSGTITCANGQFVGAIYSTPGCPVSGLAGAGSGTGDGNACVPIAFGATTVGSTKINCNSANMLSAASLPLLLGFALLVLLSM